MPSFPSNIPNQMPMAKAVQIIADQKKSLGSGKKDLNNAHTFIEGLRTNFVFQNVIHLILALIYKALVL
jgi:hypothetical protein